MKHALTFLLIFCTVLVSCKDPAAEAREKRERAERHERYKMLDTYYEKAWIECANEIGRERCRLIQESGFWQCQNYSVDPRRGGVSACAEDRLNDRYTVLEEAKVKAEELKPELENFPLESPQ